MTAKELIAVLINVPADTEVLIARANFAMGSSQTGMYETGLRLYSIETAKLFKADELGASCEYEKRRRVELLEKDES